MSLITIDHAPPAVPTTPLGRCRPLVVAGGLLVSVFLVGFGIWATFAPLETAVVASGTVVSESSRKTIQHLEGGIVAAILVKDGDAVKAGQTLIRLDDTKARTTYEADSGQLVDLRAAEARLIAQRDDDASIAFPEDLIARKAETAVGQSLAGQQKIFDTRRALEASKIAAIRERINQSREEIVGYQAEVQAADRRTALLNEEIKGALEMLQKGLERKPHYLELQRNLADIQGKRGETVAQIARAKETIAESEVNILNVKNDDQKQAADELRDTQRKIHELSEETEAARAVMDRTRVRAPVDGIVTDLRVHTVGGVVTAGEPLLDLVPQSDRLVIEAEVRPVDIDRLRQGLSAQVRLLPYKSRRTPPLDATVTYVSADRLVDKRTNQPYFSVKLAVDDAQLKAMPEVSLVPGMPAETMIRTGVTTVALYALAPVLDSFHRAFHEK
ncbi:MAG TPA: HlyD family type I secretion periplasmic adaptor subunit [Stellaceae bacterium]|nr:HlyD family type I secretion periplasmic adaptor subunit [Stellaceae bacterium]